MRPLTGLTVLLLLACSGILNKSQEAAPAAPVVAPPTTTDATPPAVEDSGCLAIIPGSAQPSESAAMTALFGLYDLSTRRSTFPCPNGPNGQTCTAEVKQILPYTVGGRQWVALTAITTVPQDTVMGPATALRHRALLSAVARGKDWCVERLSQDLDQDATPDVAKGAPEIMPMGNGRAVLKWNSILEVASVGDEELDSFLALDRDAAEDEVLSFSPPSGNEHCVLPETRLTWTDGNLKRETYESRGGPPLLVATQTYVFNPGEGTPPRWSITEQPEQRVPIPRDPPALADGLDPSVHAEILTFDPAATSAPIPATAEVVRGLRWRDSAEEHQVFAVSENLSAEDDPHPTTRIAVSLESNTGGAWATDWRQEVLGEGFYLGLESLHVTDLDGDGVVEVWIATGGQRMDIDDPPRLDVLLREGADTATLSGSSIGDRMPWEGGGDYTPDAAFIAAPELFKTFGARVWREHCGAWSNAR